MLCPNSHIQLFYNFFFIFHRIWKGFDKKSYNLSDSLLSYISFDEKAIAVDAFKTKNIIEVIIGLVNGDVVLWRLSFNDECFSVLSSNEDDNKLLFTHADEVTDVAFSKDGSKIASCGLDRYLYVCDIETGMILFKNDHPNSLICLNWCYDNQMLYLGDNTGLMHVWNMMSGEKTCTETAFDGPITCITSKLENEANKCRIIAAGVERNEFVVKAWINE